ncbi:MAG: tRNA (adenosine(37)-N6)-dimethylallyltransferase MiaA [Dictyoglomaceae bacterium]|nr:tRNA (adenosine(37)-N6)-dimethylallyltransferase MiaA [Dictyoglomaceae bacterium]
MKIPIVVILGPTGVGKTELSIKLAPLISGEIISVDSMQVYKEMDIGTAKPSKEEREKVPHHLIDIVPPDYPFTSAEFKERAEKAIYDIHNRGKIPILVGGTALYFKVLFGDFSLPYIPPDYELRRKLYEVLKEKGEKILYSKLKEVDPASSQKIHPHDHKRIIRALEVYIKTGKPISELAGKEKKDNFLYTKIGLYLPKDIHLNILEERIEKMFERGLVEEVRNLWMKGIDENCVSMQGIGYKEILGYLKGKYSQEEAKRLIIKRTKLFVKRQFTWFKKDKEITWFNVKEYSLGQLVSAIYDKIIKDLNLY